ncbi:MAG: hypothetical protein ACD_46C00606G0005 [uncultured bacterium]|nr:MAG: hypothetical protein ACD_46C00606G0005 [uncultured bacterium]
MQRHLKQIDNYIEDTKSKLKKTNTSLQIFSGGEIKKQRLNNKINLANQVKKLLETSNKLAPQTLYLELDKILLDHMKKQRTIDDELIHHIIDIQHSLLNDLITKNDTQSLNSILNIMRQRDESFTTLINSFQQNEFEPFSKVALRFNNLLLNISQTQNIIMIKFYFNFLMNMHNQSQNKDEQKQIGNLLEKNLKELLDIPFSNENEGIYFSNRINDLVIEFNQVFPDKAIKPNLPNVLPDPRMDEEFGPKKRK